MNDFWKIAGAVIGDDCPIGLMERIIDVMIACNLEDEENKYMLGELINYCTNKLGENNNI